MARHFCVAPLLLLLLLPLVFLFQVDSLKSRSLSRVTSFFFFSNPSVIMAPGKVPDEDPPPSLQASKQLTLRSKHPDRQTGGELSR